MMHFEPKDTHPKENENYKAGDTFMIDNHPVMLCSIDQHTSCVLINLEDGTRWRDPIEVKDVNNITAHELSQMYSQNIFTLTQTDFKLIQI